MELDQPAPDFDLPNLDGRVHRLSDYRGRIVVVNFWSCECPHSERTDRSIVACVDRWAPDVVLLAIAANRNEPAGALESAARTRRLPVVLRDTQASVADRYAAQTTPHVFVVDRLGRLRYRGAVDDVGFGRRTVTRSFLEEAVEALLDGRAPPLAETPAHGCTIVRDF